jgi:hypothetical protein
MQAASAAPPLPTHTRRWRSTVSHRGLDLHVAADLLPEKEPVFGHHDDRLSSEVAQNAAPTEKPFKKRIITCRASDTFSPSHRESIS